MTTVDFWHEWRAIDEDVGIAWYVRHASRDVRSVRL